MQSIQIQIADKFKLNSDILILPDKVKALEKI